MPTRTSAPGVRKLAGVPWRWGTGWALASVAFFLVEVFIALRVHDRWIRPYGGDALVVVLVYAVLRAVTAWPWRGVLLGTLAFAFSVEGLQALRLVHLLHLEGSRLWSTVIGTSADVSDLASYSVGAAAVWLAERARERRAGRLANRSGTIEPR